MKKFFTILAQSVIASAVSLAVIQPAGAQIAMASKNVTTTATAAARRVLTFDRVLVYEQTDYNGSVVRYQVFVNSQTGEFGFDKKLANLSMPGLGSGYNFATGQPDGSYHVYVADKTEGKVILRYSVGRSYYADKHTSACHNRFQQRYRATGRAGSQYGLTATEYRASLGRKDSEWIWVAQVPFNAYPLYLFNEMALEAKLPDAHTINFSSMLAPDELMVQSKKEYYSELVNGKPAVSTLRLVHFGPIKHSFDATGYRFRQ